MKKKIIAALTLTALALLMFPAAVFAAPSITGVYIADTRVDTGGTTYWLNDGAGGVTSAGAGPAGYNVIFEPAAGSNPAKLTLKNVNITKNVTFDADYNGVFYHCTAAMFSSEAIELVLEGTNSFRGADSAVANNRSFGVYVYMGLTVTGTGSLVATGGNVTAADAISNGVYANNITVESGALTGIGGDYGYFSQGVEAYEDITVNNGLLEGRGGTAVNVSKGIAKGTIESSWITVNNGIVRGIGGTVTGDESSGEPVASIGIWTNNYGSTINGGTYEATGGNVTGMGQSYGANSVVYLNDGIARVTAGGGNTSQSCGMAWAVYIYGGIFIARTTATVGQRMAWTEYGLVTFGSGVTAIASLSSDGSDPFTYSDNGDDRKTYLWIMAGKLSAAEVGDATVSGFCGNVITNADITIDLTNASFNALAAGSDASGFFTNMPVGLSAAIKTAVADGATSAVITISGTPAAESAAAMALKIPKGLLKTGNDEDIAVNANANAKWNILAVPAVTMSQLSFQKGSTPDEGVKATVKAQNGRPDVNASNNFSSVEIDGAAANVGGVGTPGSDGSVENGSIIISFLKSYLDKLSVGTHTVAVTLKGGVYDGLVVTATINVTAPTGNSSSGRANPNTGLG